MEVRPVNGDDGLGNSHNHWSAITWKMEESRKFSVFIDYIYCDKYFTDK